MILLIPNEPHVCFANRILYKAKAVFSMLGGWYHIQYVKDSRTHYIITRDLRPGEKAQYNMAASLIAGKDVYGKALYINHNYIA